MVKNSLPILLLGLLLSGCATTTITNLTPSRMSRTADGSYQVEAALKSRQQTIHWDSITATVRVGNNTYPMRPTPLMTNRWETLIPGPTGGNTITYRFKFDFKYNVFGAPPQPDSNLSKEYKLQILD